MKKVGNMPRDICFVCAKSAIAKAAVNADRARNIMLLAMREYSSLSIKGKYLGGKSKACENYPNISESISKCRRSEYAYACWAWH